ncbi:hypothetical protein [Amycolatopsis sp. NPDC098790]|uniref:hypothetical protein n=1 Tax=Amycolatopsis sp. NPDC098790 TaxID=3363939 RepID=UPI003802D195
MTEDTPIEHHRAISYQVKDYELQPEFSTQRLVGGHGINVTGICPGCGGRTTTNWYYGTGNGYKAFRRKKEPVTEPADGRTVCCDCGHGHADRPADEPFQGCGAHWRVKIS